MKNKYIDRSLLNTLTKAEVMQYIEDLERIIEGAKKDENLQNLAKVFQNSVDKLKVELEDRIKWEKEMMKVRYDN